MTRNRSATPAQILAAELQIELAAELGQTVSPEVRAIAGTSSTAVATARPLDDPALPPTRAARPTGRSYRQPPDNFEPGAPISIPDVTKPIDEKVWGQIYASEDSTQGLTSRELLGTYNTYRKLRKVIGILGMSLPVLLVVLAQLLKSWHEGVPIHWELENSISAYYYTKAGGLFVGTLFAIGVLLLSYNYRVVDTILTTIACGLAIIVALCPTPEFSGQVNLLGILHYVGASGLFFTFGYMALLRFTKSDVDPPDVNWENRRRLYQACGAVIFAMLAVALVLWVLERLTGAELVLPIVNNNWLFWVEVVMVEAFGLSWLVKGGFYFFGPLKVLWAPPLRAGDTSTSDAVRRRLPGLVLTDDAAKQI